MSDQPIKETGRVEGGPKTTLKGKMQMKDTTKTCGDCRFYRPEHAESTGYCHANPPVIVGESLVRVIKKADRDSMADGRDWHDFLLAACDVPVVYHDYPACRLFELGVQQ